MADITNAIYALVAAIVLGISGVAAAYFYQWKVALPRQFKQRDEQRQLELENVRKAMENRRAAEAVDIERDRMLPILIENMMQSNRSTVQMAESFHATMMQNIQQTATWNAQLKAHDGQLTTNTDRLEELAQMIETSITNLQLLKSTVETNTDHSKSAAVYSEQAAKRAQETLELVRKRIIQVVEETKHDTSEMKTIDLSGQDPPGAVA